MSTLDNLKEATRTTLVQALGLDKPNRLATLVLVEVTTLGTRQLSSMLKGLDELVTLLLVKITTLNTRQSPSTLDNLFHPQVDSELGKFRFSKGSSNPRSTLGESRFSNGSSNPRSALHESHFSKGLSNPRSALGESRIFKGQSNPRSILGESRISKGSSNQGPPLVSLDASLQACQTQDPPRVNFAKTQDAHILGPKLIKPKVLLGEPLHFQISHSQKSKVCKVQPCMFPYY